MKASESFNLLNFGKILASSQFYTDNENVLKLKNWTFNNSNY